MGVTASLRIDNFERVEAVLAESLAKACLVGAETTAEDARRRIEEQEGSGRKYPQLPNRSSAPGESPVNQFGKLVKSIEVDEEAVGGVGAAVVVGEKYGEYLEMGTPIMAPRPFLGPASEAGDEAVVTYVASIPAALSRIL